MQKIVEPSGLSAVGHLPSQVSYCVAAPCEWCTLHKNTPLTKLYPFLKASYKFEQTYMKLCFHVVLNKVALCCDRAGEKEPRGRDGIFTVF